MRQLPWRVGPGSEIVKLSSARSARRYERDRPVVREIGCDSGVESAARVGIADDVKLAQRNRNEMFGEVDLPQTILSLIARADEKMSAVRETRAIRQRCDPSAQRDRRGRRQRFAGCSRN